MSLNKVLLIGNAGRDPEIRHLESGAMNATFSLATTERYRDRSTGEMKEQTGRIRTRSYNDKDGNTKYMTEILADNMQLLGRKADNPGNQGGGYSQGGGNQQPYQPQQGWQQGGRQQQGWQQPQQNFQQQGWQQPQPQQPQEGFSAPAEEGDDLPF